MSEHLDALFFSYVQEETLSSHFRLPLPTVHQSEEETEETEPSQRESHEFSTSDFDSLFSDSQAFESYPAIAELPTYVAPVSSMDRNDIQSPTKITISDAGKGSSIVRIQSRQTYFQSGKPVEITLERLAEHFHESLE
eukprot:748603-Hanusia_phi.AAC.1